MSVVSILAAGLMHFGYYSGQASLYPYGPVYCDGKGDAGRGCFGVMIYTPDSAPLPPTEKHCTWADIESGLGGKDWYRWEPRTMTGDDKKYKGDHVCFLEDRGEAREINDLPRD